MSASRHWLNQGEAEVIGSASSIPLSTRFPRTAPRPLGSTQPIYITDDLLFDYQRCNRRAFLDLYGDPEQRDPPTDYLIKLRQDSVSHHLAVLGDRPVERPNYARYDWTTGAAATLQLMRQGVERISQGVLMADIGDGLTLVSSPDLLIRQPGYSELGDWLYVPMEIRLGKRPKLDYQVIAAYHAYVLAQVQGAWSENAWLYLRQRGAYEVDLVELLPRMEEVLQGCIETVRSPQEPEVFIAHNRCDLCHWFSHCYQLAQERNHLSLLPGVTPSRYVYLHNLGLTTLEALATADPRKLEDLPGFGAQVAHKLIRQAQSTLHNRPLGNHVLPGYGSLLPLHQQDLPTAPVELYFDIEAAPEQNLVYLHGVLVVDREAQTTEFHPLLAEGNHEEQHIWEVFLDLVWRYPTAPIFHFCPYEVQTVKRLAEQYDTPATRVLPLLDRFVDLHERVTRLATLPVESYALKSIARWLGFHWRDPDANGAQSIYWYAQWLEKGDRTFLEAIVRYNEDDCRATHRVKDWLVEFVREMEQDLGG